MPKITDIIVKAIVPAIKQIGKAEMEIVLTGIKENNKPEVYHNTLQSLHSSFSLLKEVAVKTKTKLDDGIVDLVLEAVADSAEEHGIELR